MTLDNGCHAAWRSVKGETTRHTCERTTKMTSIGCWASQRPPRAERPSASMLSSISYHEPCHHASVPSQHLSANSYALRSCTPDLAVLSLVYTPFSYMLQLPVMCVQSGDVCKRAAPVMSVASDTLGGASQGRCHSFHRKNPGEKQAVYREHISGDYDGFT